MWSWGVLAVLGIVGVGCWLRGKRQEDQVLRDIRTTIDKILDKRLQQRRMEFAEELRRVDEEHGIQEQVN